MTAQRNGPGELSSGRPGERDVPPGEREPLPGGREPLSGGPVGGPVDGMELAEAVEAVRQGLMAGAVRGTGSGIRFEVGEIHMEFSVQLQRTRTGRAGVKAWVVDAGADASRALGRTHTVSFTLRPVDAATGRSPLIAAPDEGDVSGLADVSAPGDAPGPGGGDTPGRSGGDAPASGGGY